MHVAYVTTQDSQAVTEDEAPIIGFAEDLIPKYDEHEVAELFRISVRTVRGWRLKGGGPAYVKIGDQVRYSTFALLEYIDQRTVQRG